MSTTLSTLNHFIESVPICEQQAPLKIVLSLFQMGQKEVVVVVNKEQVPLGAISSRRLMSHLMQRFSLNSTQEVYSYLSVELALTSLSLGEREICPWLSLMEPLTILPHQMSIPDFLPYLQGSHDRGKGEQFYALVDGKGKFLGLLNPWNLLQSLLLSPTNISDYQARQEPQRLILQQQLWCDFLTQLPLPLMLQSEQGQILCQSRSWREQIGDLIPPGEAIACPISLDPLTPLGDSPWFWQASKAETASQLEYLNDSHYLSAQFSVSQLAQLLNLPTSPDLPIIPELPQRAGEKFWQFIKFPLPSPTIGTLTWLVLAMDVTEQQQLFKELGAKNSDLMQLNRLKDEFLACITHELKSPLTSIVGLSTLLKEQKVGELNPRQERYTELIYQSGRRLMSLVNDLLDLTRVETGQLKLNPVRISLKTICERAYLVIEEKYKLKTSEQISFTLEIEPGLEWIEADEVRLQQMLVHLLDNGIKFTQPEGEIGLKVNHWEDWIAFTIWDTGIGIPEECQSLIFQKFQQLENPLTRTFEGTGLGLVLSQRLAKAHGGDISFISKAGQGSEFTLLLPPSLEEQRLKGEKNEVQKQRLVLIVEAVSSQIEDLAVKLTSLDYRVVIARTGTEAVEKARGLQPYGIFLNPMLPLLSGWDVLSLLKGDRRTCQIPVIVTATATDRPLSEKNGADGFLSLPIETVALQNFLNQRKDQPLPPERNLTILRLHPESSQISALSSITLLSQYKHRILEADDLEQADLIARVWNVDVLVLDGKLLEDPLTYLRSLSQHEELAALPLITLDAKTTEAANQIPGLAVFPALIPENEQNFQTLLQVIQIAAGTQR